MTTTPMSRTLTERLRSGFGGLVPPVCDEAANTIDALTEALRLAYVELNEIHARDGVPYTSQGWKASVTQEHFTSVVETCRAALKQAEASST